MEAERARLAARIQRWNESCLDLFGMSGPDEALEFHAVVRFQVQAEGAVGRVHSTCVRVTSSSSAVDVLRALEEKLQTPLDSYGIFELLPGKDAVLHEHCPWQPKQ
ncbi:afadin-like [Lampetra fluviatilis]